MHLTIFSYMSSKVLMYNAHREQEVSLSQMPENIFQVIEQVQHAQISTTTSPWSPSNQPKTDPKKKTVGTSWIPKTKT